ncbi:hypothetical protein [Pontibacter sp. G13]|uniref:hypothetical protein n=1 Tax=Pontibacter sp. G13 TaxID=3074898 RepID=UPI00288C4F15|nr:hypothetical protein [Pontibacter sp. G13]WNJ21088.1 hypothetical protein RJD25_11515 [Pontibacter sp. G13]
MSDSQPNLVLESVQNDVAQVGETLKMIAQRVISEGISDYPVFIASQTLVDMGKPIFDRDSIALNWFFNASILEEFVSRQVVTSENVQKFKEAFGDPAEKACIFVLTEEVGQFVFVPYDVDGSGAEQAIESLDVD